MSTRIFGVIPDQKRNKFIEIFGYKSKGVPGIEIIGPRGVGRTLKEKFIYIMKTHKIGLPLGRYVICVNIAEKASKELTKKISYLELPTFLTLLSLGDVIKMRKLDDCFACGNISVSGKVSEHPLEKNWIEDIYSKSRTKPKYITNRDFKGKSLETLPLSEILYFLDRE